MNSYGNFLLLILFQISLNCASQQTTPEERCKTSISNYVCIDCFTFGTCVDNGDGSFSVRDPVKCPSPPQYPVSYCDDLKFESEFGQCSPIAATYTDCGCTRSRQCSADPNDPRVVLHCENEPATSDLACSAPALDLDACSCLSCSEDCPLVADPNNCTIFYFCSSDGNLYPSECISDLCFNEAECECLNSTAIISLTKDSLEALVGASGFSLTSYFSTKMSMSTDVTLSTLTKSTSESSTVSNVPSSESSTVSNVPSSKSSTVSNVPSSESSTGETGPTDGSSTGEFSAGSSVPSSESSTSKVGSTGESSTVSNVPLSESSTSKTGSTGASSVGSSVSSSELSTSKTGSTGESSTVSNVPSSESSISETGSTGGSSNVVTGSTVSNVPSSESSISETGSTGGSSNGVTGSTVSNVPSSESSSIKTGSTASNGETGSTTESSTGESGSTGESSTGFSGSAGESSTAENGSTGESSTNEVGSTGETSTGVTGLSGESTTGSNVPLSESSTIYTGSGGESSGSETGSTEEMSTFSTVSTSGQVPICPDSCPFADDPNDDCERFYYCARDEYSECPPNFCFDEELCTCASPSTTTPPITCPADCPFIDNPNDTCRKYYFCYNGQLLDYVCPIDLCFSQESCSCVDTNTVTTTQPTTTTTTSSTGTKPIPVTTTEIIINSSPTPVRPSPSTSFLSTIFTNKVTTTSTSSTPSGSLTCPPGCNYVDDPNDDCNSFFICDGGNLIHSTCSGVLCFDQAACLCE